MVIFNGPRGGYKYLLRYSDDDIDSIIKILTVGSNTASTMVKYALNRLTTIERDVLLAVYSKDGPGVTQEVADELGLSSRERLRQVLQSAEKEFIGILIKGISEQAQE